jgi:hypothetical protein
MFSIFNSVGASRSGQIRLLAAPVLAWPSGGSIAKQQAGQIDTINKLPGDASLA